MSDDSQHHDQLCQYSYKPCPNLRTTKRNGSLHLLCEFHRQKANAVQNTYAANKKRARSSPAGALKAKRTRLTERVARPRSCEDDYMLAPHSLDNSLLGLFDPLECHASPSVELTIDEYILLHEIF
ncbi:hypothetical protein SDRG_02851 [Saprolegnia diclina VS20]|uniref:Uncharacterized protein n=1 Tax=Saprolegnia diclina (strain VS20) TaxID=1156394 RepID=T0S510_SAPDV|nr:hypothetical protein SDRG_02851 [Saprolegnia diclina VS20]EQC40203.1 hypothetical protein SDRG_02851 [Saprolegnia diclina VS20]|eukprot:XP_008606677.1 hypothetical protein SDRG_02851 [Saprolegnia diclina VS20]